MPIVSAGILLYRRRPTLEVLLAHPGGPYWRNKDEGAWTMPKGHIEPGEAAEAAARREFGEEIGTAALGEIHHLCRIRQAGGKWVEAFALEGDLDAAAIVSNTFPMEWPPRSGRIEMFPEVDRASWFTLAEARLKILKSQLPILDAMQTHAGEDG